jgi:hypothetical protein
LGRLEIGTFGLCLSLKSVYIGASVEFPAGGWFIHSMVCGNAVSLLELRVADVRFGSGSKLPEIEIVSGAFFNCHLLTRLCIPASVEKVKGWSLPRSRSCGIDIEPGNPYYRQQGDLSIDLNHHSILRYFGRTPDVEIRNEMETIGEACFYSRWSIRSLTFESISIETVAFSLCSGSN